jgi:multidrug efflux system membrane fusion protein
LILVLAIGAFYFWSRRNTGAGPNGPSGPGGPASKKGFGAIPVVAAKAFKGSIPVYYTALGQVWPIYTVTVRSRVDGQLMEVHYKEGEIVQKGSPLIEIDSRPYDAVLVQAQGQLIRDQALLDNARIDLARYKTLLAQNAIPEQQLATQQALVMQDEGIVKTDQGLIDTAKLNVVYSHIFAPITGRVGLRLVDPGNIVHAADTTGMLVITQIDPISVIFTLPEDQLPVVLGKLNAGQHLAVDAFDRASNILLAHGKLTTQDNQIDPTTGTLRLRADFDNPSNKLFPNQFVNARLLVQLKQGVTLVPSAVVQRNSHDTYVFLVKPDSTVTVRTISIGTVEGDDSEVTSGLNPGDVMVTTGVDKLTEGTKVAAHLAGSTVAGAPGGSRAPLPPSPANSRAPVAGQHSNKSTHKAN